MVKVANKAIIFIYQIQFRIRIKRGDIMRKAQGMPITVIIIAAIALLVLVILAVIFTGGIGKWTLKAAECTNKGGKCTSAADGCPPEGFPEYATPYTAWTCPKIDEQEQVCCIQVATQ